MSVVRVVSGGVCSGHLVRQALIGLSTVGSTAGAVLRNLVLWMHQNRSVWLTCSEKGEIVGSSLSSSPTL